MATKRHKIHKISFLSLLCLFMAIPCIAAYGQASRTLIDQYCIGCHNERLKTAGLMLDKLDLAQIGSNPAVWEKVARKVHTRWASRRRRVSVCENGHKTRIGFPSKPRRK